jgi:hypothetical protein
MKPLPTTICQQIWRCNDRVRRKTHMTPAQPPPIKNTPEAVHKLLEFMPCGVISLKHWSGLPARGIMKPSYKTSEDISIRPRDWRQLAFMKLTAQVRLILR